MSLKIIQKIHERKKSIGTNKGYSFACLLLSHQAKAMTAVLF
jgi:hypothetical protein